LHDKLKTRLIDTPNVFYRSALVDGIEGFFKLYYPEFASQQIHITADYAVLVHNRSLQGIEFIKAYLEAAYFENAFCRHFSPDDIHYLLSGHIPDYEEHLINIYEYVLTAALGCILTGADVTRLEIASSGARCLQDEFASMDKRELIKRLSLAADELRKHFGLSDGINAYLRSSLPLITGNFKRL
jgi:hypothetical protein